MLNRDDLKLALTFDDAPVWDGLRLEGANIDGGAIENRMSHLTGDEALPDQIIQPVHIAVERTRNRVGRAGATGRGTICRAT